MYVSAFVLGFFTSLGWWSASKIQKAIDNTAIEIKVETREIAPAKDE